MTFCSYEISKMIIHNIHNVEEVKIEGLGLISYCVNI